MAAVERLRLDAARRPIDSRARLGQFFTPTATARLMASLLDLQHPVVRFLDAGAGLGTLTASLVAELCCRPLRPTTIVATVIEVDDGLIPLLRETIAACEAVCDRQGIEFTANVVQADFLAYSVEILRRDIGLFLPLRPIYDAALLNPPYRKIQTRSRERQLLRSVGIETSNLYTGFMALVTHLLAPGGELVSISPRSFCNGPYFRPFRQEFLATMALRQIHLFETRDDVFRDDDVLQENIIIHAVKAGAPSPVVLSTSPSPHAVNGRTRIVPIAQVVRPDDPEAFVHLVPDEASRQAGERVRSLTATLPDLDIEVSTGRVVDFRAAEWLRPEPGEGTAPLLHPGHLRDGGVTWPRPGFRKPNAIVDSPETAGLFVPSGVYVLVKRFSAKEERRRIVAAVFDPEPIPAPRLGFENHLNYFHRSGAGLPPSLARGLAAYLNSSLVDAYYRQFGGHTQVNATDLRRLPYPPTAVLTALGAQLSDGLPDQPSLDGLVEAIVFEATLPSISSFEPD